MRKIISIRLSIDIVQINNDLLSPHETNTLSQQTGDRKQVFSYDSKLINNIGFNYRDSNNNLVIDVFPHLQKEYPMIMSKMIIWAIDNLGKSKPINLIGIGGARNSTKSTTTAIISEQLNQMNRPTNYVSMDSYIQPPEFFVDKGIDVAKQAKDPVGINFQKLYEHATKIKELQPFSLQTRDRFKPGYKGEFVHFKPRGYDFFLTEGLSSLLPDDNISTLSESNPYISMVSSIFDLKMFLKIDEQTAFRNLFNDPNKQKSLGLTVPSREEIYQRFVANEIPRFKEHYKKTESNSHIVVSLGYKDNYYYASRITINGDFLSGLDQAKGENR